MGSDEKMRTEIEHVDRSVRTGYVAVALRRFGSPVYVCEDETCVTAQLSEAHVYRSPTGADYAVHELCANHMKDLKPGDFSVLPARMTREVVVGTEKEGR